VLISGVKPEKKRSKNLKNLVTATSLWIRHIDMRFSSEDVYCTSNVAVMTRPNNLEQTIHPEWMLI
jgi:hypothetical protein